MYVCVGHGNKTKRVQQDQACTTTSVATDPTCSQSNARGGLLSRKRVLYNVAPKDPIPAVQGLRPLALLSFAQLKYFSLILDPQSLCEGGLTRTKRGCVLTYVYFATIMSMEKVMMVTEGGRWHHFSQVHVRPSFDAI